MNAFAGYSSLPQWTLEFAHFILYSCHRILLFKCLSENVTSVVVSSQLMPGT